MNTSPTISLDSQFISTKRLQWIMAVGESTVWEWNEQKAITHFHRGRIIRYAPQSVLEFILKSSVQMRSRPAVLLPTPGAQLSALDWARIERLIADQMDAKLEKAA